LAAVRRSYTVKLFSSLRSLNANNSVTFLHRAELGFDGDGDTVSLAQQNQLLPLSFVEL
jgi:hypothetical protein